MSVMNITEIQNMTTLQQWVSLPNKITGGSVAWDTILISFELVLLLGLIRMGQNIQRALITSLFMGSIIALLLYTMGLIDVKLLVVNIIALAAMSIAFLKHNQY